MGIEARPACAQMHDCVVLSIPVTLLNSFISMNCKAYSNTPINPVYFEWSGLALCLFTARCTIVQSAVIANACRPSVRPSVRLSVCPSVCNVGGSGSHRLAPPTLQKDRRTDRQTDVMQSQYRALHRAINVNNTLQLSNRPWK